jgi:hypothetical protein
MCHGRFGEMGKERKTSLKKERKKLNSKLGMTEEHRKEKDAKHEMQMRHQKPELEPCYQYELPAPPLSCPMSEEYAVA